jgi:hypothetical protein
MKGFDPSWQSEKQMMTKIIGHSSLVIRPKFGSYFWTSANLIHPCSALTQESR